MKKRLVAIICLFFIFAVTPKVKAIVPEDFALEDGAIYNIRNSYNNMFFDVKGWSSESGTTIHQYSWHGDSNQRFMLKLISGNIYEFIPLINQSLRVNVVGGSSSNGAQIETQTSNNSVAQRFQLIQYTSNYSQYIIYTGSSSNTKCLKSASTSTELRTLIVQGDYDPSGTTSICRWIFEKQEDIGPLEETRVYFGKDGKNVFEMDFTFQNYFQEVSYIIETVGISCDSVLNLYYNGNLVESDDNSGEGTNGRIIYNPAVADGHRLIITNKYDLVSYCTLRVYPVNELYFYSLDDSLMVDDLHNARESLNTINYFVTERIEDTYYSAINRGFNGRYEINNDYLMISTRGTSQGCFYFNEDEYLTVASLPEMENVKFAVWAHCYSAGSSTFSAPRSVSMKGAKASLGWPGLIGNDTANTFVEKLWERIVLGDSPYDACLSAKQHVRSVHWFLDLLGFQGDNILDYTLYGDYDESTLDLKLEEEKILKDETIPKDYQLISSTNTQSIYMKLFNGMYTNDFYIVENGKTTKSSSEIGGSLVTKTSTVNSKFLSNYTVLAKNNVVISIDKEDILFTRYQVSKNGEEKIEELFLNTKTGEFLFYKEFLKFFE